MATVKLRVYENNHLHTLKFNTRLWLSAPLQCSAADPLDTCNINPESYQPEGSPAVERLTGGF